MTSREDQDVQEPDEAASDEERRAGQRKAWAAAISARNARQRTQRARPWQSRNPFARIIPGVRRLPPERQP